MGPQRKGEIVTEGGACELAIPVDENRIWIWRILVPRATDRRCIRRSPSTPGRSCIPCSTRARMPASEPGRPHQAGQGAQRHLPL